mmetsp:Transcript_53144/g.137465  ORF Transcript_53144/g.137465 Transcript_53144/m.137465 type:complete len:127 (+) Transcript_53144:404-784(+)
MEAGGAVVDYHAAELFPERWFDLVIVMRADNSVLHSRLTSRGYSGKKLSDNIEAEIMQVILDEAREAYREEIVIEVPSDTVEDLEANVERTLGWLRAWLAGGTASMASMAGTSMSGDRCANQMCTN